MTDDGQLLRRYTDERSEEAFGELVVRHIDLVYSSALRVAGGDRHLAEDITQVVFLDLARKAPRLPRDVLLAGWLHRHTCYTAAKAVRTERRRRTREQIAMEMRALDDNTEPAWEQIAPLLDQGLNQLSASDRDALVLRFLKRQDLRAVGAALGISEDAAQKRVSRALEKLRRVLNRRGVTLAATALASAITAEAVTAAPAGLAVSVTAASLAGAAGTGTTLALLKLMAATKLKTGVLSAIVVASVVTPLAVQHQAQARLHAQDDALRQRAAQLARLRADNERLSNLVAEVKNSQALPDDQFSELMRLRGEVGRLRKDVQELTQAKTNAPVSREEVLASMRQMYSDRVSRLKQQFIASPDEAVPELQYVTDRKWLELVEYDHHRIDPDNRRTMSSARSGAQIDFAMSVLADALVQYGKNNGGKFPTDISQLTLYFKSPVDDSALRNWTILPTSSLPRGLREGLDEDWVITQKAPVNAELDQRVVIGLKTVNLGSRGTNDWIRVR
ncbi:MAG TPA: sigma-70 family RNA polymerase sigma factor [Haliangiales bacterium]|nr:sigma-70 family RNA polymerase sigma factor [Haliangiales bacterium]